VKVIWVAIACDIPFIQYGCRHSSVTIYVPTCIPREHVLCEVTE
jgi:hypothetical protein